MDLIVARPAGLYCPPGDFYIDPWRPVERAIITHAHADHARWGSASYLCHRDSVAILRKRLGAVNIQGAAYGELVDRNGVRVSLHPAGHILGSAQIRVEYSGEVWVASGDYKLEADATCAAFEPVRCDAFITESTFGLPIYHWRPQQELFGAINRWWRDNAEAGRASVLQAYALGKAQRILSRLEADIGPIVCHGAVEAISEIYRHAGVGLPPTLSTGDVPDKKRLARALVLAPPSAAHSPWLRRFGVHSDAFASGWMQVRGNRRRRGVDPGLRAVRPCRLAGSAAGDRRQRRDARVRHPWRRRAARALSQREGIRRPSHHRGIWRRGLGGRSLSRRSDAASGGRRRIMRAFAALYARLDAATSTSHKRRALQEFLREAIADEGLYASAAWTVYFLAGGKPRQMIATKLLRRLALDETQLPEWLFEECYQSVGDLAETLALLLPAPEATEEATLDAWMNERLLSLRSLDEAQKYQRLRDWTRALPQDQRLPFFKLTTGALRIGVSKLQVIQALSDATGVEPKRMAQRMMGYTQAGRTLRVEDFAALIASADGGDEHGAAGGQPDPFFLAHSFQAPVDEMPGLLGPVANWLVEWKFDGIRAQYIHRAGQWQLWSRGEELVSESFPELAVLRDWIASGTVLDGELVVVRPRSATDRAPPATDALSDIQPFASLQQRLGRKSLGAKILKELPVALVAYDILEHDGRDVRPLAQSERRRLLEATVRAAHVRATALGRDLPLRLSPSLHAPDWRALDELRGRARSVGAEGMMLKAQASPMASAGARAVPTSGGNGSSIR